jgi:hypothetical protein
MCNLREDWLLPGLISPNPKAELLRPLPAGSLAMEQVR